MVEECMICLELIDEKSIQQKCCKKKFHKECLLEWIHVSNNNSCPLCRTHIEFFFIKHRNNIEQHDYKINDNFFKNNNNNIYTKKFFIQLKQQSPRAWITADKNFKNGELIPLYVLKNNIGKIKYISHYLRHILLWNSLDKSKIFIKVDDLGHKYLSSSQKFENKYITENNTTILVCWLKEVMHEISHEYKFTYKLSMNTLIMDITISSLLNFKATAKSLQLILTISIYNIIEAYNNHFYKITIENLKELLLKLNDTPDIEWNEDIDLYQKNLISKYIDFT